MSLIECKLKEGLKTESKADIRKEICSNFAKLTGIGEKFFAVLFDEYETENFQDDNIDVFVLVYQSEGRSDAFKDAVVRFITEAFHKYAGWEPDRVGVLIVDILKGSMGNKGVIVNRSGPVAEAIKAAEIEL